MPINFSTNGSTAFTKPPRIITVADTVSGCPPTRASNPILSLTMTLANTAIVAIEGEIIRRRQTTARCDLSLYGPGYPGITSDSSIGNQMLDSILDYNDQRDSEWDNAVFRWAGYVPAGTQTFYCDVSCLSLYGCGINWGRISAIIFE